MTDNLASTALAIEGMTCASCVARVEKNLAKIDGVTATVNLATERAQIVHPPEVTLEQLVTAVEQAGYHAAPVREVTEASGRDAQTEPRRGRLLDRDATTLRNRVVISAALTVPIVLISMIPALQFTYWQWLVFTLTTPVVVWAAYPFHRAALINARHGNTTMDTLVSLGISAAYIWSVIALFFGHAGMPGMTHTVSFTLEPSDALGQIYLETAAVVTTFILLGRYLEERSKQSAGDALHALLQLGSKRVWVRDEQGVEREIAIADLQVDDLFLVRPGEQVATDGRIVEGVAALDESAMTGESLPREVGPGDDIIGATLNTNGFLLVRATRVGEQTQLARMARIVEDAQAGKSDVQRLADRISAVFVPIVMVISVVTFVVWMLISGEPTIAFSAAVAVLIIACPCALGLAIPVAVLVGTGRGAQLGILIRGPEALETSGRIDTIVFDKTGTVTEGKMALVGYGSLSPRSAEDALQLAASVEHASEHPIGRALVRGAEQRGHELLSVRDATTTPGLGITAWVARVGVPEQLVAVTSLDTLDVDVVGQIREGAAAALPEGQRAATVVAVTVNGTAEAWFAVADELRSDASVAVGRLRELGLRTVLLSGDAAGVVEAVATAVGVDEWFASATPEDKVRRIEALQAGGHRVAMVGDGVNDAAAIAVADLGIAVGSGTSAAIEASDLTLMRPDLMVVVDAIRLSRRTLHVMRGNLFWAFAYNVVMIPLASLTLLNPMLAGAAMAFSSVFVVLNSLRLRRFTPA